MQAISIINLPEELTSDPIHSKVQQPLNLDSVYSHGISTVTFISSSPQKLHEDILSVPSVESEDGELSDTELGLESEDGEEIELPKVSYTKDSLLIRQK